MPTVKKSAHLQIDFIQWYMYAFPNT